MSLSAWTIRQAIIRASQSAFPPRRTASISPTIYKRWLSLHAPGSIRAHERQKRSKTSRGRREPHIVSQVRRDFSSTPIIRHGDLTPPKPGEERHITFIDKDGTSHEFEVADGDNLLDIAQAKDLEMEGACGGSCACSTCHIIVGSETYYDRMEEPSDDENDMLDLAFGLTETSRLGCQIKMSNDLDGLVVKLPSMTRNLQASDFAEKKEK